MTRDEIIEMARQAGWKDLRDYDSEMRDDIFMGSTSSLETFAKLVAAKEREACAKVCEHLNSTEDYYGKRIELFCAEAIRARRRA